MIDVPLATTTLVAAVPPIVTPAPARKPVPVMVTDVPPAVVPDVGAIVLIVGAGLGIVPWPLARNVATCMTHTEELVVAVAL